MKTTYKYRAYPSKEQKEVPPQTPSSHIWQYHLYHAMHPLRSWRGMKEQMVLAGRWNEVFVQREYGWLYDQIQPHTTLIDIGANIGDTAIFFSFHPNIDRIICYEPSPLAYEELRKNLAQYMKLKEWKLENKAISSKRETKRIGTTSIAFSYTRDPEPEEGKNIEAITLGTALKGLKNVAIKCDAEGSEEFMFDEANLDNVYAIQLEAHGCGKKVLEIIKSKEFEATSREGNKADVLGYVDYYYSNICAWKGKRRMGGVPAQESRAAKASYRVRKKHGKVAYPLPLASS